MTKSYGSIKYFTFILSPNLFVSVRMGWWAGVTQSKSQGLICEGQLRSSSVIQQVIGMYQDPGFYPSN